MVVMIVIVVAMVVVRYRRVSVAVIVVMLDGVPARIARMRSENRDQPREDGAEQRQKDNCLIQAPP